MILTSKQIDVKFNVSSGQYYFVIMTGKQKDVKFENDEEFR